MYIYVYLYIYKILTLRWKVGMRVVHYRGDPGQHPIPMATLGKFERGSITLCWDGARYNMLDLSPEMKVLFAEMMPPE